MATYAPRVILCHSFAICKFSAQKLTPPLSHPNFWGVPVGTAKTQYATECHRVKRTDRQTDDLAWHQRYGISYQSWGLRPWSYNKTGLRLASVLVLVLHFWSCF